MMHHDHMVFIAGIQSWLTFENQSVDFTYINKVNTRIRAHTYIQTIMISTIDALKFVEIEYQLMIRTLSNIQIEGNLFFQRTS